MGVEIYTDSNGCRTIRCCCVAAPSLADAGYTQLVIPATSWPTWPYDDPGATVALTYNAITDEWFGHSGFWYITIFQSLADGLEEIQAQNTILGYTYQGSPCLQGRPAAKGSYLIKDIGGRPDITVDLS